MRLHRIKKEFASANLHHLDENALVLSSRYKYVHLKTHWAPEIIHQNLAIILRQLYRSKISFKVLIPGRQWWAFQSIFWSPMLGNYPVPKARLWLHAYSVHRKSPVTMENTKIRLTQSPHGSQPSFCRGQRWKSWLWNAQFL